MNQGNPDNPQNGFTDADEDEAFTEGEEVFIQDPHPILGDVLVRRAISHAVDVTNIVNKVAFGQGAQLASGVLPAVGWAFDNDLEGYAYDLDAARALLDEAGWVPGADGVRVKDGNKLELKLQTNAGNEVRENIIVLVQESLNDIGFDIEAEAMDFGSLVGELVGQSFDLVLLGWTGKGTDPDDTGLWEYRFDTVGSGFNFTSYYNPRMEELGKAALTLPGCATDERASMYKEIQTMLHDDAPYVFMYNPLDNTVWNTRVQDIDPAPWSTYYNVQDWFITD
jgi:peptide/nickel transport system substrate-binding protein